ncbi:MAG: prepilin peptidase [Candidatus Levybacteria bacterium]|nr:prepilin peptidase [Candidatus Levybacteria bacterium]
MIYILSLVVGFIGLFVGSFLGVLTDRLYKNRSFIFSRSKCDKCKKNLGMLDLIPLLSFIFLQGKCRYCKVKLSYFYPIIELITAILFFITFFFVFSPLENNTAILFTVFNFIKFFVYIVTVSLLIVVFFIDLKYGVILDKVVVLLTVLTLIWLMYSNPSNILNHILTSIFSALFFALIVFVYYLIRKKIAMGGGDIKLALFLGLFLGFPNIILCLYIAFLTAAIYSIILIIWRKNIKLTDSIPFGPFLTVGFLITLFWSDKILSFIPLFLKI